ncbi:hypothetical protein [Sphingobacterium multivorum]|uniref:Uncharacterized protein n=1 Tax=Sphingobacterium multivorum TaxID=28454 RepID=A0A654D0E8_SPHMU|nr:hypothetical protein [Sphingobacterium multivorum]VXC99301.1 hypothetical protein SPHINGO8BC_51447 [Sphingobacterium multivorum]
MYREIYFHSYSIDNTDKSARVSIRKKDYSGSATYVDAGPIPFTRQIVNNEDDKLGGIYPTSCIVQLIGDETFGMEDIYTASDVEYQIVHLIDDEIDWIGYMLPESFEEEDTDNVRYLNITGFDGLTKLKDLPFVDSNGQNYGVSDGNFLKSFLFVIKECLLKTGLQLEFMTLIDRKPIIATGEYHNYLSARGWSDGDVEFYYGDTPVSDFAEGNYINYYIYDEVVNKWTAKILGVTLFETGTARLKLSNPFILDDAVILNAQFFSASDAIDADVLDISNHDVRTWVNTDPDITDKERSKDLPYFNYSGIAFSSWDVLNNLAIQFDFKVVQSKGKWMIESIDKDRVSSQYYSYDHEGVFIKRENRILPFNIPCEDELKFKFAGNVRSVDKTLKKVSVNYNYRYRVEGDPLTNLIKNGDFNDDPVPVPNPATFTPNYWQREVKSSPITFNIQTAIDGTLGKYIQISTPDEFNSSNMVRPMMVKCTKGDILFLEWSQRINEWLGNVTSYPYVTIVIELKAQNGDVYYLVNDGEEDGWTDRNYMSSKPKGRWLKKGNDGRVFHFNNNYSPSHNPTNEGNLSAWGHVTLRCEATPSDGIIAINFVGSARKLYKTNKEGHNAPMAWSYVFDVETFNQTGEYKYTEDNVIWSDNVKFWKSSFNPYIQLANVSVTRVSGTQNGKGRVYRYEQDGEYFDTIENVQIFTGDENNVDHLSQIIVNGVVTDKWITSDNSLDIGPIGMLLAKSIMRRYYRPCKLVDGGIGFPSLELNDSVYFEDDSPTIYSIKQGDVSLKNSQFNGTLQQMGLYSLPYGGEDLGAGSLTGNSSSNSSGSSGATQSWVVAQNYLIASDATLQKTLERGSESTIIMTVKGVRNNELLSIPTVPPEMEDRLLGEKYIRWNDGYIIINDDKAKVGDSDKWEGQTYSEKIGQGLKSTDSPTFNKVTLSSLAVGSDDGLDFIQEVKQPDDSIVRLTVKSGVIVKREIV